MIQSINSQDNIYRQKRSFEKTNCNLPKSQEMINEKTGYNNIFRKNKVDFKFPNEYISKIFKKNMIKFNNVIEFVKNIFVEKFNHKMRYLPQKITRAF